MSLKRTTSRSISQIEMNIHKKLNMFPNLHKALLVYSLIIKYRRQAIKCTESLIVTAQNLN